MGEQFGGGKGIFGVVGLGGGSVGCVGCGAWGGGLINDNYSSPSATIKMTPTSRGALDGFLWFWGGLERWVWGGLGL